MSEKPTLPDAAPPPDPERATRADRRGLFHDTWELELLISGALVFGLLQIPGRISGWWDQVSLHLTGDLRFGHFLVYYYLTLIVYVLITAFCLHIASRAYWVGLIGLRSVYPEGPDWDSLEGRGAIGVAFLRRRVPTLDRAIGAADDFCSSIFAFATLVVALLVVSVVLAVPIGLVVYVIKRLWLPAVDALVLGVGLFYLSLVPALVAGLIDRRYGDTLSPDGLMARIIRLSSAYTFWIGLGPLTWPVMATFSTRTQRRRLWPLVAIAATVIVVMFLVDVVASNRDGPAFESFTLFPESRTDSSLTDAFYEDRRGPDPTGRLPYIQSDIIEGPYARLFVPYYPNWDEELIAELCDEPEPFPGGAWLGDADEPSVEQLAAGLTCLARRFDLRLDGEPVASLDWSYAVDPATGARGTVAYLDVRDLAPGRHEIRLVRHFTEEEELEAREQLAGETGDPEAVDPLELERERRRYVIAFWR